MRNSLYLSAAAAVMLSSTAFAADLPRRVAPPPVFVPVPVFTWTGAYFGIHAGYAWTEGTPIYTIGNQGPGAGALIPPANTNTVANVNSGRRIYSFSDKPEGFTGGGQVGYNYQFTPGSGVVIGVEADASYTDLETKYSYLSSMNDPSTYTKSLEYLGTARGRLGYAFDRFLVYGTGGFAYGSVKYGANFFSNAAGNPLAYTGSFNEIQTGYTWGGGVEYALPTDSFLNFFRSSAVTMKVEYLHYDLGAANANVNATGNVAANGSYKTRFYTEGDIVRAGLNFKFGAY